MDVAQYLRVFRAHWLGIVLLTLAGVVLAYGWALLQPQVYSADSTAIVRAKAVDESEIGMVSVANSIAAGRVKTYAEIGTSRSVAQRVIDELGLHTTPDVLIQSVTITNPLETVSLHVTANGDSPRSARDIAEAWVEAMALEVNQLESGDQNVQGVTYLTPLDSARLPSSPSSPNVRLALAIGGLLGLAAGIAYGLLRYTLDRRIRSVEGVEKATGVAVVGTIPLEKTFTAESRLIPFEGGNATGSANAHLFGVAEALRELRTNIQFMDVDHPPRVIVVTSPLPGDGKSTTASNLAITLAAAGQHTILIDGDLRRPMISTIFGLVEGAGLTDVLAGRAELADVAQPVGRDRNLVVVSAGKIPPNPSEVLGSERMRELLAALAEQATVIVDAPPLIPVTDAAILANRADGAVVVSTVGKTTYDALGKALGNLERAGARALGVVLNRVPRKGSGAAYYGYQYHGEYYRPEGEAVPAQDAPAADGSTAVGTESRRAARR
ncbi:polysaccharide biosynthesis tyrosine autokinase [Microbacterium sp.]|uniref:polysaccharide biosynthesis tyrosine autokinase n=1 Tax=Microbacterium sp. TaxID=51671 RepID=UPI0039E4EF3E